MMRHIEGGVHLLVSGASPVEANVLMASQGVPQKGIAEAFSLIAATLQKYRVERFTCITIADVQIAASLIQSRPSLTFFDSLHAAISKRMDLPILSSDPIYHELGVEWVDLRGY
jgi:predicted nucleic acid-binding protein